MVYRSAIVDECGEVMYWCSELEDYEVEQILEQHTDWHKTCVEW